MGVSKKDLRRILARRPRPIGAPRRSGSSEAGSANDSSLSFPMEPTDGNVAVAMAAGMRCVHCGSADHWVGGPKGGLHHNVTCGCCGQGVNACASVPELSHALNERTDLAIRASFEADGGTIRDRTGSAAVGAGTGTVH